LEPLKGKLAGFHSIEIIKPGANELTFKAKNEGGTAGFIADAAFDQNGELFAFNADMERDLGSPWYRPTRVNHVVSGLGASWRSGTGKRLDHYPESLPVTADIGPGSPTGKESTAPVKALPITVEAELRQDFEKLHDSRTGPGVIAKAFPTSPPPDRLSPSSSPTCNSPPPPASP